MPIKPDKQNLLSLKCFYSDFEELEFGQLSIGNFADYLSSLINYACDVTSAVGR